MRRPSRSVALVRPLCLAAFAALTPAFVAATSYTISTFADDAVVNGNCTLREAIRAADSDLAVDECAAGGASDAITLLPGTYPFSGGEALNNGGSLSIQSSTLNPFQVSIDLAQGGRFLRIDGPGSFVLGGLEIKNGSIPPGEQGGGAIWAFDCALRIFNFRLVSNSTFGLGGALLFMSGPSAAGLTLSNGSFISNSAVVDDTFLGTMGGAAYVEVGNGAGADLRDVTFLGNSVLDSIAIAEGGALFLAAYEGSFASCVRCNFESNSATATAVSPNYHAIGGAVRVRASSAARIELVDSRFTSNAAFASAAAPKVAVLSGFTTTGGTLWLERLFVDFNGGAAGAGTIDMQLDSIGAGSDISLLDSQLTFGIESGLGVSSDASSVYLGHVTIADYPSAGIDMSIAGSGWLVLQNSIVAFNGFDMIGAGPLDFTTNMVGGDPLFLDEPNGDYHLSSGSPAIDAGTTGAVTVRLADLDHRGRIAGAATDIGCYEVNGLFAHGFEEGDVIGWSPVMP